MYVRTHISTPCVLQYYRLLTLNIPSLARQRCLPRWGPRRTPWYFFVISQLFDCGRLLKLCFLGFWKYNSVIQALLASNILCLFISTEVTVGTELLHNHSSLIQHLNNVNFWALSAGHFSNLQRSEPKNNKITTFRICNVVYQAESRWDPKCVFNFLRFFERTLYKSNYIIFILSWCGTHTKIRSYGRTIKNHPLGSSEDPPWYIKG